MKSIATVLFVLVPLAPAFGDSMSLEELVGEFKKDPVAAKAKHVGKQFTMEIEIQKRVTDASNTFHQAKAGDIPKTARVLFKLPKLYRPTAKLVVTATLKLSTWDKDDKRLSFEPVTIDKELEVLPPLFTSLQLLQTYMKSPQKVSEEYVGKTIDLTGQVKFIVSNTVVLEYVPKTNAAGKIEKDSRGFEKLGRPLVTVKFAAADAIRKANLAKGANIELRGEVEEMKAGAITIKDATLTK